MVLLSKELRRVEGWRKLLTRVADFLELDPAYLNRIDTSQVENEFAVARWKWSRKWGGQPVGPKNGATPETAESGFNIVRENTEPQPIFPASRSEAADGRKGSGLAPFHLRRRRRRTRAASGARSPGAARQLVPNRADFGRFRIAELSRMAPAARRRRRSEDPRRREFAGLAAPALPQHHKLQHEIGEFAERRTQHPRAVEAALQEHALAVREGLEAELAVIGADAGGADAAER